MRSVLKKTFDGVPMFYSTETARSVGATHGWSVDVERADVFLDKITAQRFVDNRLSGDPEVMVEEKIEKAPNGEG